MQYRSIIPARFLFPTVALFVLILVELLRPLSTPVSAADSDSMDSGKSLSVTYSCVLCHGTDFKGKPGLGPNLRSNGIMKKYSKASFERMLDSGDTPSGKSVVQPMLVFHLNKDKADSIFAYLKRLK